MQRLAFAVLVASALPSAALACGTRSDRAQHWNELNLAGEQAYGDSDLAKARDLFDQALTEADRQHLEIERASTLNDLGLVLRADKDYDKAEVALKEALSIREKRLGAQADCTGVTLNNLAELYFDQGRFDLAETGYLRALKNAQTSGSDAGHTATVLNNLGAFYYSQAKFAAAEPYLQRALDAYTRIRDDSKPSDPGVLLMDAVAVANGDRRDTPEEARIKDLTQALLNIYQRDRRYPEFRRLYVRFVRDHSGFVPESGLRAAHSFAAQAEKFALEGKRDDAEAMYNRALASYEAAGIAQGREATELERRYVAFKQRPNR